PKGAFYDARTYVSWGLLAILFGIPFIKVNGEPLLLFNILERNFIIFGIHFTPQDFHLFVFAMLTFIVFIVLFTVIFGRLFCGWVCPQTIFMEMLFRKVEYWIEGDYTAQKRLDKAPWSQEKFFKKGAKHLIFVGISVLIAHTFLSYILGLDRVTEIVSSSPTDNLGGFGAMIIFTGVFYFVFARLREQVCTTICPYGRLQGVLTDKNTIQVSYDFVRGEPRGKMSKAKKKVTKPKSALKAEKAPCKNACDHCTTGQTCPTEDLVGNIAAMVTSANLTAKDFPPIVEEKPLKLKGDCIDCKLCVKVCPTGIDIRDGVQMECINCTACMDACDEVMVKIGREKGLIRYDSSNGIETKSKKIFTPRVIAYTAVLAVLMVVNIAMLGSRSDIETLILRTPGMLYQKVDETHISNLYNYQIFNKTNQELPITFKLASSGGLIKLVGKSPTANKNAMVEGALFIEMEKSALHGRKNDLIIEIYAGDKLLDKVHTNFFGPSGSKK
ncbi:MAG: 4Fe-4S dicluster domain-containing protein, partial [Saprospiraceae bacterium]